MKLRRIWLTGYCVFLLLFSVQCQLIRLPTNQQQSPDNQPAIQQPRPIENNQPQPEPLDNNPPFQPQDNPQPDGQFRLEGIWEAQVDTEFGTVYSELILEPTRTFSQQVLFNDLMTYDTGTYQVGQGFIHFAVENHEPKVYKGQEMTWVNSFTYFYTPVDANSMILEDRIASTRWTVYRK
jgi:hypothetical protein